MAATPSARVTEMVAALTLDEKAGLTAGVDFWSTLPVPRVGLPRVRVTDGPNGARGPVTRGEGGLRAVCVPCGTALGASWDVDLLERVGALLGTEARRKACRVLLAPTVNIHRSPLAGRNFECYSEDPLLSGRAAAALIRGVQAQDVATTVKHLVANDAEYERTSMSSEVDERTLREIYLLPFELAVKEGGSLGVMTSYNRLNGIWCTEDEGLLRGILRDEWGFEGFVVTDWYGVTTTEVSPAAGVDLEMPGPGRAFGAPLAEAVRAGTVAESDVDAQVSRLLSVFERVGALDDTGEEEPGSADEPADRELALEAAVAGTVLLTNDGTLPLDRSALRKVAVVGPNAAKAVIMGGGSSHVEPFHVATPLEALTAHLGSAVEVVHEPGVDITRAAPTLKTEVAVTYHAGAEPGGDEVRSERLTATQLLSFGPPQDVPVPFTARATCTFTPDRTGPHLFTLAQAGGARLSVGGTVLIDGIATPLPAGRSFMGFGSREVEEVVDGLVAGEPVEIAVDYTSGGSSSGVFGLKVGVRPLLPPDAVDRAVAAAADADVAVVVVGTDDEWESEGFDRRSMDLPGDQEALIRAVAAANPRTVVVVNAGAPVTMGWVDDVAAVAQVWFGGQAMAEAIAQVLTGDAEPGGRLPTTIPERLEHNPSWGTFPGDHDRHRYGEGVFVGYRWYQSRHLPVRFPFGHGLSYTTFTLGTPVCEPSYAAAAGSSLVVEVPVTNTGSRSGSEVVQLYVAPPARSEVPRPAQELKAYAKVHLAAGESAVVRLELDDRSFVWWDTGTEAHAAVVDRLPLKPPGAVAEVRSPGWRVEPGTYELRIGRSSADVAHAVPLAVSVAGA